MVKETGMCVLHIRVILTFTYYGGKSVDFPRIALLVFGLEKLRDKFGFPRVFCSIYKAISKIFQV